jgi:hypothetical protein
MSETDKVGKWLYASPAQGLRRDAHSDNELGTISRFGSVTNTRPVLQSRAAARTATIYALVAAAVADHQ